jgi:ribose-phosphate pyrophosphokinase
MNPIIFAFPNYENIANSLIAKLGYEKGFAEFGTYPDGESHISILSSVKDRDIVVVCGLDKANNVIMNLIFFTETAREFGAKKIILIAPYLGYMRQDKRFKEGEAITSNIFANMLSQYVDFIITIDPHLHRHKSLNEIYSIPSKILHASEPITNWIKNNITNPLLIGPDDESGQWVSDIAGLADAPFIVLKKIRRGDRDVEISVPDVEKYKNHTPVLVDDIISTARTMIETVNHLNKAGLRKAICIGIHATFSGNAYQDLQSSWVEKIVTCNTISHTSNVIDVSGILAEAFLKNN